MSIIVGLGNPGEEYENTRHNTGRIFLEWFRKKNDLPEWEFDKKLNALVSEGKVGKGKFTLVCPETFMNKSGNSLKPLITSIKKAQDLVVVHDDLDLPIGRFKISYNKSSGGHRGIESIMRAIKTEEFTRFRIGISPTTSGGKLKKPHGEAAVEKAILGKFKDSELSVFKKISKDINEALAAFPAFGPEKTASVFGGRG